MFVGRRHLAAVAGVAIVCVVIAATARAMHFTDWSTALKIDTINGNSTELNTTSLDGCPIQSPDGLSLYMASNRPGGLGGLDIWVAHRASSAAPFGAPENLGEPVNSAADDFCPTPVRGKGLFLVSREALPGSCGQGDIYFTSRHPVRGWNEPQRLACAPAGPNTALDEQGPSFVDLGSRQLLYFSTSSVTPAAAGDIFVSARRKKAAFGPAIAVAGLNDAIANDIQPNIRKDGLEVVFSSNRAGGAGGQDIWSATRDKVGEPWSAPVNVGGVVNTGAAETRPSLSWDGDQLLFGRSPGPEGMSDIYVSAR
ncbi:MAG: PD40 domain-containing protein [Actinobacteria bacterium]|nr:PD40 domain-containing protein [Actinomycetota bacterium]